MKTSISKKCCLFFLLSTFSLSVILYSCRKNNLEIADNPLNGTSSDQSTDELLNKWSQANNGRWLPYSIRLAKSQTGATVSAKTISNWADNLRPVNVAKAYYRELLSSRLGLVDVKLDNYLDSVYLWRYKSINGSLKYRKTMDSLFVFYQRLDKANSAEINNKVYIPGQQTRKLIIDNHQKIMAIKSGNPGDLTVQHSSGCVPPALTDWFDQHYNQVYTKLINDFNSGKMMDTIHDDYLQTLSGFLNDACSQRLFDVVFAASIGVELNFDNNGLVQHNYTCGETTDSLSNGLMQYYGCQQQQMPQGLLDILADGDPFEDRYNNVYLCHYQLTATDQMLWNIIGQQDQQADA